MQGLPLSLAPAPGTPLLQLRGQLAGFGLSVSADA
jgi:hypothetical protein